MAKKLEAKRMNIPSVLEKHVTCTALALYRALPWIDPVLLKDTWKQVRLEANREQGWRTSGMHPDDVEEVHRRLGVDCCLEKNQLVVYDRGESKFRRVGPMMRVRDLCKLKGTFIVGAKHPWHELCVHDGQVYDHYWSEAKAHEKTITEFYRVVESQVPKAQENHDQIYMGRIRAAEERKEKLRAERSARMKARYQAMQAAKRDPVLPSNGENEEATAVALLLA